MHTVGTEIVCSLPEFEGCTKKLRGMRKIQSYHCFPPLIMSCVFLNLQQALIIFNLLGTNKVPEFLIVFTLHQLYTCITQTTVNVSYSYFIAWLKQIFSITVLYISEF